MVVVGGAWPLLMTLTPASDRPWISGTSDNSIWSLIFGYNGLGRIDGQAGAPGAGGPGGGGAGGFFGGATGPFRLLNSALGGQAGWLLGVAVVGGIGLVVASRLRRSDARTGWLIAIGGAFATTAVAFSFASGIFHPYYVSLLAPFAAALVGATAGHVLTGGNATRIVAPLAILGGMVTELLVLHNYSGQLTWLRPLLVVGTVVAAAALAYGGNARWRALILSAAMFLLLLAPASWAVQTLGHATSGTFPAGGPASVASGGMPGGRTGSFRGQVPGGGSAQGGFGAPPSAGGGFTPPSGAGGTAGTSANGTPGAGGGSPFGSDSSSLTAVSKYVKAHGGGTVAVSSQQGAAASIIRSGTKVAGIGGFSGRESEVSVKWLAEAVQSGRIRWVLADANSGGFQDGRVGASKLMAAVEKTGTKVLITNGGTLYDLSGKAAALLAQS